MPATLLFQKFIYCITILLFFQVPQFCVGDTGADKYIIGHYRNNLLHSPIYEIDEIPAERLTHIIYQHAEITPEAKVILGNRYLDIQKLHLDLDVEKYPYAGNFAKLMRLKEQRPQLKTIISIGKWGQSNYFRESTKTADTRSQLITSAIDFMLMYGFDGIDIYWQPFEDKPVTPEEFLQDRKAFIQFMIELRADLQRRKSNALLTASVKMPCLMHPWNMKELSKHIDFINVHAAYFHGAWEQTTNHISPIYDAPWQHSIDSMMKSLLQNGMPSEKIILDIGTYGQAWQGIRDINHGLQQPATNISLGSWDTNSDYSGLYSRYHTEQIIAMPGYEKFWDDKGKASYAFNPTRFNGHFISYESIQSLDAKIDYMNNLHLSGIGLLDMHNEKHNKDSLLVHIHSKFYPWDHVWISANDFFKTHYQIAIWLFAFIGLQGLLLVGIFYTYMRKRKIQAPSLKKI